MDSLGIRPCTLSDLSILQKLSVDTFRQAYEPANDPIAFEQHIARAFNLEQLTKELNNPESRFFFLEELGKAIGFLKLNIGAAQTEFMEDNYLEIERIYLLGAFKGQGYGRLLMDFAIDTGRADGKEKIWLGVWEENPKAIAFYKHLGFQIVGSHTFMLADLPELDWVMERVL